MPETVVGIFDDFDLAQEAVAELVKIGFDRMHISLIRRHDSRNHVTSVMPDPGMAVAGAADSAGTDLAIDAEGGMSDGSLSDGEAAAAGAGAGAVIGATAGILGVLGGLFIPGLGALLGIGPVAATILGGAGIGAVAGGLSAALVHAGVSEQDAADYSEGVRRGGTLVTVVAESEQRANDAADVLSGHGAFDIQERAAEWRRRGERMTEVADLRGEDWSKVEPEARTRWERNHPGAAWDNVKADARCEWERRSGNIAR
jgi:hypothetical protein